MKKLNVLYLIDSLHIFGGTENYLFQLATNLNKDKFQAVVGHFAPEENEVIRKFRENGILIKYIPLDKIYDFNALKQAVVIKRLIKKYKIDIVQTFHLSSDLFGTLVSRYAGVPVIISSRRDLGFCENNSFHHWARRIVNHQITKIHTVSKVVQNTICYKEHIPFSKTVTLYSGVNMERFNNSTCKITKKKELKLNPEFPVIGTIANIKPIKGIEFFVEGASIVLKSYPNSQFIIIGDDLVNTNGSNNSYKDKLDQQVETLGIRDNVHFLGKRFDIPEILQIMDVYVSPSLSEGFSNTIIESMATEKPVVATDVGGNSEAVKNNRTGFIVPPKNAGTLADAVIRLLKNPELGVKMGKAGKARAKNLFSRKKMMSEMEFLYSSLHKENLNET
ncbi:glycosyltransferase [candidate division KSB1 bacterium]|nr:glycosyltransferase [candidate division KSB1 bacterium]